MLIQQPSLLNTLVLFVCSIKRTTSGAPPPAVRFVLQTNKTSVQKKLTSTLSLIIMETFYYAQIRHMHNNKNRTAIIACTESLLTLPNAAQHFKKFSTQVGLVAFQEASKAELFLLQQMLKDAFTTVLTIECLTSSGMFAICTALMKSQLLIIIIIIIKPASYISILPFNSQLILQRPCTEK